MKDTQDLQEHSSMLLPKRFIYASFYIGPIFIVTTLFLYPLLFGSTKWTSVQITAYLVLILHYAKRTFESLWVHRFGESTMHAAVLLFGVAYYWVLGGAIVGYSVLNADYLEPKYSHPGIFYALLVLLLFAEYMNLRCHMVLRDLRPPGTNKKGIPYGYGFDWVSCANYFWEIITWLAFASLFRTIAAIVFLLAGAAMMTNEALRTHASYNRYFDGKERQKYPSDRKAIIPCIL